MSATLAANVKKSLIRKDFWTPLGSRHIDTFFLWSSLEGVNSLILFRLFVTGVVDTGGKFHAGVVDTGANLPPVSTTQWYGWQNLLLILLIPEVSCHHVVHTGGKFAYILLQYMNFCFKPKQIPTRIWGFIVQMDNEVGPLDLRWNLACLYDDRK